jgi:hypothetical protein
MNKEKAIFKCLDTLVASNQKMTFVDAYMEEECLGANGTFIDCIPNATAYHHSEFGKMINTFTDKIIICCPLINHKGEFNVFLEEGNTGTFFGMGREKPCTILFIDVPYEEKEQFFLCDFSTILCAYEMHVKGD